jgi:NADP-dependent 3-hydroxy acid dehydrogenase YdfG
VRPQQALRVIISGASSGIGAALARHYAASGATLGLIARRRPALERLAAELGAPSEIYSLDVRDTAALAVAARDFIHRHGCPDLVVANAGVSLGTLTEHSEDRQMGIVARVLRVLPNWLYDRLFANAPHKPRRGG